MQIEGRYEAVPVVLSQVLVDFGVLLEDGHLDDTEVPLAQQMREDVQLAYTVSEMVVRDCLRAIKTLRMGADRADSDRYQRNRDRDVDSLIAQLPPRYERAACGLLLPLTDTRKEAA